MRRRARRDGRDRGSSPLSRAPPVARDDALADELVALARGSAWLFPMLETVRSLRLHDWCIGAGAIRNLVWDALHGYAVPSPLADVDVAYFDAACLSSTQDRAIQERLDALRPDVPWEVTNQAGVHLWFESHFGHAVEPLRSLADAVASWPETATSVALRLEDDDRLTVIAPFGLADLFACVVRRNPTRVSEATYRRRIAQKRYDVRWPRVHIVSA